LALPAFIIQDVPPFDPSLKELADVREVVETLSSIRAFANVESVQKKKRGERGGFEEEEE